MLIFLLAVGWLALHKDSERPNQAGEVEEESEENMHYECEKFCPDRNMQRHNHWDEMEIAALERIGFREGVNAT